MNANSLETLLAALAPEEKDAASAYRSVHARLTRFFSLQDVADPAALADEVMDRLAASLVARGAERIPSPGAFALGIARHLLQEETRRQIRERETVREWMAATRMEDATQTELAVRSLDRCLDRMPADRRELLRSYYAWTSGDKIGHHRRMAEELGLSANALRNRLQRARAELLACLRRQQRDVSVKTDTVYRNAEIRQGES